MSNTNGPAGYAAILTNLEHARCVVVGGGAVAERKVRELLAGGARPLVISPALSAALASWRYAGAIEHAARPYRPGDLAGAFLVIAATDDRATNAAVAAEAAGICPLVNIADAPDEGTMHTAAVVRRGQLLLAVSTGGAAPALAARISRELAERYGEEYAELLSLLGRLRAGAARELPAARRAALWRRLVSGDELLARLRAGDSAAAEAYALALIGELSAQASGAPE